MTATPQPRRHAPSTRFLHWVTAGLVFAALFIGFVMVSSVSGYARLVVIHKTLGVTILVVVLVRVVNRLTHRGPALPATVGSLERKVIVLSEVSLYALLLIQPLVGWAVVSAGGSRWSSSDRYVFRASHRSARTCFGCFAKPIPLLRTA